MHPGVFKSNPGKDEGHTPLFWRLVGMLGQRILPDASVASQWVLYLAASPEVEGLSGLYFANHRAISSPPQTYDIVANQRLWQMSAALTGLSGA